MDWLQWSGFNLSFKQILKDTKTFQKDLRKYTREFELLVERGQYQVAWIVLVECIEIKLHLMRLQKTFELLHWTAGNIKRIKWIPKSRLYIPWPVRDTQEHIIADCNAHCKRVCITLLGIRKSRLSAWCKVDRFLVGYICRWMWKWRKSPVFVFRDGSQSIQ